MVWAWPSWALGSGNGFRIVQTNTLKCQNFWAYEYILNLGLLLQYMDEEENGLIIESKFYEIFNFLEEKPPSAAGLGLWSQGVQDPSNSDCGSGEANFQEIFRCKTNFVCPDRSLNERIVLRDRKNNAAITPSNNTVSITFCQSLSVIISWGVWWTLICVQRIGNDFLLQ